jgi:glycosyltransferase involved in cell wall biosynthesis
MKVTVITTVYNRVAEFAETVQSVLQFARPDLEYIVIDGGSTDGTVELIRTHSNQLKHWLSEPDRGIYDAMNKGWALADPESRVLFLGAGDRLLALPNDSELGQNSDVVLYGNVQLDRGHVFHARAGIWLKLFNSLHHQALLIPKQLHPEPPFDLLYPLYADFDFNQRLCLQGVSFRFEPGLLSYAAPDGLTRNLLLDELAKIIRKNYGPVWSGLSILGFSLVRVVPILRALRPIR